MASVRLLLIVLVLLNLLAFAANMGWLGTSQPDGEPERITNQLNPERIVLAENKAPSPPPAAPPREPEPAPPPASPPAEAPAPSPSSSPAPEARIPVAEPPAAATIPPLAPAAPADACVAYATLNERQAAALDQASQSLPQGVRATRSQEPRTIGWWVRIPPLPNREAAERMVVELRAQGVSDFFIIQEPGPNQFAVSLGMFRTENAARQHHSYLLTRRIRTAEVAARTGTIHRVEVRGPAAELSGIASRLAAAAPAATREQCTP